MPRRRMVDPFFWNDRKVGKLSRDERSLILGCVGHADDDGRLEADPSYLKAMIFKYDEDLDSAVVKELRDSCLSKMQSWPANHPYRMVLYTSSDEEYIFFPAWGATNKPSHPTESQLPAPPPELIPIFSSPCPEELAKPSGVAPSQSRSGQSSQGKVRLDESREVQEDFTNYLNSEKDLTDFLTQTLTEYLPRGPTHVMSVVKKLWLQGTSQEIGEDVFQVVYLALRKYPPRVLAKSLVKGMRYSPNKVKPAKYIQTVFDEQMREYEKEHPP